MGTEALTGAALLDSFTGAYGQAWKAGVLSDHAARAREAGLVIRTLSNGSTWVYATGGGRAVRLVCSEIIWIDHEDGRSDGRCGLPTVDGFRCAGHYIEDDGSTCEHGLSAALCAGPGHYPTEA